MNLSNPDLSNAPRNYDFIAGVWRAYFSLIGATYINPERIPASGPAIIAPNHLTAIDPFGVGLATPRRVHFMAKQELYGNALLRWYMNSGNAFPVDRGRMDVTAIKTALRILQGGQLLVMFPQGHRGAQESKGGASFLALRAKVPVIPVGIALKPNWFGGKRFTFAYGEAIPAEGSVEAHTERVSSAIFSLQASAS
jgi:1-acyl-sn-glycerol-3-phosphate acyltransferase